MAENAVIIVGAGLGGMTAAIMAAQCSLKDTLVEKSEKVGGAASYSGGSVWVGANHVAEHHGLLDSTKDTLQYVQAAVGRDAASVDADLCERWQRGAGAAAHWLEQMDVIGWELIPDYPDCYYPRCQDRGPLIGISPARPLMAKDGVDTDFCRGSNL